jgi:antitoxin component YwqK of YwqJK toxin-antitoxin module
MCGDYISSISVTAKERIVVTHDNGSKARTQYTSGGKIVGVRLWDEEGNLELETPLQNQVKHGIEYSWDVPGIINFAEPFENGIVHGQARQWSDNGCLMGTYTMVLGTGIDLWRAEREDGSIYLAEVLYLLNGQRHGFDWWLNEDQTSVYIERHWAHGQLHGIEREWNKNGRVCRGFPRYNVSGQQVTKRQYIAHCRKDQTLLAFDANDNQSQRVFPSEIARHLTYAT